jgi:hypothetical protein
VAEQSNRTTVIVAVIGLISAVSVALISSRKAPAFRTDAGISQPVDPKEVPRKPQHETQPASQPESTAPFPIGTWRLKGRADTADPGWLKFNSDNTVELRYETPEFHPWGTWIYDEPGRLIIMMVGKPPGTRQAWAVSDMTEKSFVASEDGPGCKPCVYDALRQ